MMTNAEIADNFSLLSKLMDIHGENEFKAKSYSAAAYSIEKLPVELNTIDPTKYATYKGIGNSAAEKIKELLHFGEIKLLKQLIEQTPAGILEMMSVKGLGPKKIAIIWKELGIESPGELLYACEENRLSAIKGFGEKSQTTISENIAFFLKHRNIFLYADMESFIVALDQRMKSVFPEQQFNVTGEFRRQMEIVHAAEWVTTVGINQLKEELSKKVVFG
jgi:DNA polymerase (family 10)